MAQPHNDIGTQKNSLPYGISTGDTSSQIIGKIAAGLGVEANDPSVMQEYANVAVGAQQQQEAENDAHNQKIYHDALTYGRVIENYTKTIGDTTYHSFTEVVPGR